MLHSPFFAGETGDSSPRTKVIQASARYDATRRMITSASLWVYLTPWYQLRRFEAASRAKSRLTYLGILFSPNDPMLVSATVRGT